jgi:hypothetical protein
MAVDAQAPRSDPLPHVGRPRGAARGIRVLLGAPTPLLVAALASLALAGSKPHYDVPGGFTRCAHATAWHGFFKWASARNTSCAGASAFLRSYAAHVKDRMPTRVDGYRCRIFYWRDSDHNVYASRHTCERGDVVVRFYGMV